MGGSPPVQKWVGVLAVTLITACSGSTRRRATDGGPPLPPGADGAVADASDHDSGNDGGSIGVVPCGDEAITIQRLDLPATPEPYSLQRLFVAADDDAILTTYEVRSGVGTLREDWHVGTVSTGATPSITLLDVVVPPAAGLVYPFGFDGRTGILAWTSAGVAIAAGEELGVSTQFHEHMAPSDTVYPGPICTGGPGVVLRVCDSAGGLQTGVQLGSWDADGATMTWSTVAPLAAAPCGAGGPVACSLQAGVATSLTQLGSMGPLAISRWNTSGRPAAAPTAPVGMIGTTAAGALIDAAGTTVALVFDAAPRLSAYRLDGREVELIAEAELDQSGSSEVIYRGSLPTMTGWMILFSYRPLGVLSAISLDLDRGFGSPTIIANEICSNYGSTPVVTPSASYLVCNTDHDFYLVRMCRSGSQ